MKVVSIGCVFSWPETQRRRGVNPTSEPFITLGTGGAKIASAVATRIALTSTVAWILMLRLQKVVVCELTGKL